MRIYVLDGGGPKDSENILNSFLTKCGEKVFWQIGTDICLKKVLLQKGLMIGGHSILKSYVNITIGQYIMLHIVKANGKTNRNFRSHPASSKSSCSIVCAPLEVSFLSVFLPLGPIGWLNMGLVFQILISQAFLNLDFWKSRVA